VSSARAPPTPPAFRVKKIETACVIIKSCLLLHNFSIADQPPSEDELQLNDQGIDDDEFIGADQQNANNRRQQLINTFPG
jgi:hypothetical protein